MVFRLPLSLFDRKLHMTMLLQIEVFKLYSPFHIIDNYFWQ